MPLSSRRVRPNTATLSSLDRLRSGFVREAHEAQRQRARKIEEERLAEERRIRELVALQLEEESEESEEEEEEEEVWEKEEAGEEDKEKQEEDDEVQNTDARTEGMRDQAAAKAVPTATRQATHKAPRKRAPETAEQENQQRLTVELKRTVAAYRVALKESERVALRERIRIIESRIRLQREMKPVWDRLYAAADEMDFRMKKDGKQRAMLRRMTFQRIAAAMPVRPCGEMEQQDVQNFETIGEGVSEILVRTGHLIIREAAERTVLEMAFARAEALQITCEDPRYVSFIREGVDAMVKLMQTHDIEEDDDDEKEFCFINPQTKPKAFEAAFRKYEAAGEANQAAFNKVVSDQVTRMQVLEGKNTLREMYQRAVRGVQEKNRQRRLAQEEAQEKKQAQQAAETEAKREQAFLDSDSDSDDPDADEEQERLDVFQAYKRTLQSHEALEEAEVDAVDEDWEQLKRDLAELMPSLLGQISMYAVAPVAHLLWRLTRLPQSFIQFQSAQDDARVTMAEIEDTFVRMGGTAEEAQRFIADRNVVVRDNLHPKMIAPSVDAHVRVVRRARNVLQAREDVKKVVRAQGQGDSLAQSQSIQHDSQRPWPRRLWLLPMTLSGALILWWKSSNQQSLPEQPRQRTRYT